MTSRWVLALIGCWIATCLAGVVSGAGVLVILAMFWLVPLPVLCARAQGRPFDPLEPVWLFAIVYLLVFGLVPGLQLLEPAAFESLTGFLRLSPPHYLLASILSGLGFLAFLVGYFAPAGGYLAAAGGSWLPAPSLPRVAWTAAALTLGGVLALEATLLLADAGDASVMGLLRGELRDGVVRSGGGRGYLALGFLALSLGIGLTGIALVRWAGLRDARRRAVVVPGLAGLALASAVIFGGVLGSRQLAIVTVVQLLVVYHLLHRPVRTSAAVAGGLALGAGGVAFISLRNTGSIRFDPVEWVGFAAKTFDGFNFLVTGLARIDGFLWGRSLAEDVIWTYLPRFLYPEKPLSYGIVTAQDAIVPGLSETTSNAATFPPGLLAEGYVNLGIIGLLLLPMATGLLLRTSYDWARTTRAPVAVLLLGALLGNQSGLFRGFGPVVAALLLMGVLLLPLLVSVRLPSFSRGAALIGTGVFAVVAVAAVAVMVPPVPGLVPPARAPGVTAGDPAPTPTRELRQALAARGEVVLLAFGASWCEECQTQQTVIAEMERDPGVRVVPVAVYDLPLPANALARANGLRAPVTDDGEIANGAYRLGDLPSTVIVSKRGRIACTVTGKSSIATIRAAVARTQLTGQCS